MTREGKEQEQMLDKDINRHPEKSDSIVKTSVEEEPFSCCLKPHLIHILLVKRIWTQAGPMGVGPPSGQPKTLVCLSISVEIYPMTRHKLNLEKNVQYQNL